MSGLYQFTPQAEEDLFEIWRYIAGDNVEAADRVEQAVYAACEFLAAGPMRGHVREDLTNLPVRFWTLPQFPNYLIVYAPQTVPLQILRVLHGSREVSAELG